MELVLSPRFALPAPHPGLAAMPEAEPTDAELIQRIGDGDMSAFETLYLRFSRLVFGLALRQLRDRGLAEDAVQETFASVWRSAASYRPDRGPGSPWLYAIGRNAIVDRIRSQARGSKAVPDTSGSEAGPDERAEEGWVAWQVHRAFDELPETERRVLELAYWGGLSQSQIADFVGIPLGTVKTRTRSGLARLAGILDGEGLR